jgi:hypothetical protein
MAREGYLILDSDLHMMEPDDLWTRYLDEPFRSSNPPRFLSAQQQQLTPSSEDKGNADGLKCKGLRSRHMGNRQALLHPGASCGAEAVRVIRISPSHGRAASTGRRP